MIKPFNIMTLKENHINSLNNYITLWYKNKKELTNY